MSKYFLLVTAIIVILYYVFVYKASGAEITERDQKAVDEIEYSMLK